MLFYICFKIHYAPCAIAVIVLMYLLYCFFSIYGCWIWYSKTKSWYSVF